MLGGVMLINGYDFSVVQAIIMSQAIPLLRYSISHHALQVLVWVWLMLTVLSSPENVSDERIALLL